MDMLDEENYVDEDFEMESVSRPSSDASQLRSSGGDESDSSLDPLLACMPGTEFQEEEEVQKFLQVNQPHAFVDLFLWQSRVCQNVHVHSPAQSL